MLKKSAVIVLSLIMAIALCGCSEKSRLDESVSRIRDNAFIGQSENYVLNAYPEVRETPMIADGKINPAKKIVIIKLKVLNGESGEFTVNFTSDKEYSDSFSFSAFSDCFVTSIEVDKLPDKPFIATITHNGKSENLNMESLLLSETVSSETALKNAYKAKKEYVDGLSENGVFCGEVYLRLITEGGKNYWYVGFITKETTLCLLLSGKGEVLEEKSVPNPV